MDFRELHKIVIRILTICEQNEKNIHIAFFIFCLGFLCRRDHTFRIFRAERLEENGDRLQEKSNKMSAFSVVKT